MIDEIVEKYTQLRDKKSQLKAEYEAKVAPIQQAMDKVEAYLLAEMQKQGVEAFKTGSGTAYKQERTSATVADRSALLDFARAGELWQLLDIRVAKTAVDEYVAQNKDLPPGVNYRKEVVVNVRRS